MAALCYRSWPIKVVFWFVVTLTQLCNEKEHVERANRTRSGNTQGLNNPLQLCLLTCYWIILGPSKLRDNINHQSPVKFTSHSPNVLCNFIEDGCAAFWVWQNSSYCNKFVIVLQYALPQAAQSFSHTYIV